MNLLRAATVCLFVVPLSAQQPPGIVQPPKTDTEVVDRPETADEKKQRLLDQVRRLEDELTFIRNTESGGGLLGNVKHRLRERTLSPQQVDDPGGGAKPAGAGDTQVPVTPAPMPPKKARLLGDEEKKKLPEGTIFTVDGLPVSQADFQEMFSYLRGVPNGGSEEESKSQAIDALIRRKAAEAAFPDGAIKARDRMVQAQQKLKDGTDFAKVAETMSDCSSKTSGGDLGFFGRLGMDVHFTAAGFALKDGEVSKPVQTMFGYHLIKRTGFKKGQDANGDQVKCSHILAMYADDQFAVRGVGNKVNSGQIELAFVSDDYRKLAPATFR